MSSTLNTSPSVYTARCRTHLLTKMTREQVDSHHLAIGNILTLLLSRELRGNASIMSFRVSVRCTGVTLQPLRNSQNRPGGNVFTSMKINKSNPKQQQMFCLHLGKPSRYPGSMRSCGGSPSTLTGHSPRGPGLSRLILHGVMAGAPWQRRGMLHDAGSTDNVASYQGPRGP